MCSDSTRLCSRVCQDRVYNIEPITGNKNTVSSRNKNSKDDESGGMIYFCHYRKTGFTIWVGTSERAWSVSVLGNASGCCENQRLRLEKDKDFFGHPCQAQRQKGIKMNEERMVEAANLIIEHLVGRVKGNPTRWFRRVPSTQYSKGSEL